MKQNETIHECKYFEDVWCDPDVEPCGDCPEVEALEDTPEEEIHLNEALKTVIVNTMLTTYNCNMVWE